MRQVTEEQKRDYILNFLGATSQEVIVKRCPLFRMGSHARMLITEFGGELSLGVKNDAFIHIASNLRKPSFNLLIDSMSKGDN